MGDKPCVYIMGHAELLDLGQDVADGVGFRLVTRWLVNVVVRVNHKTPDPHSLDGGFRPCQDRINCVRLFALGIDEQEVFLHPLERIICDLLTHAVTTFVERLIAV